MQNQAKRARGGLGWTLGLSLAETRSNWTTSSAWGESRTLASFLLTGNVEVDGALLRGRGVRCGAEMACASWRTHGARLPPTAVLLVVGRRRRAIGGLRSRG